MTAFPVAPVAPVRFQVSHRDIAREARNYRGQWILVRHYQDPITAERVARCIRTGHMGAYQPSGRYRSRTEPDAGQFAVYIRCAEDI